MKRSPLNRTDWKREHPRTVTCEVRSCKKPPEGGLPVCGRHGPGYLFTITKLGELAPGPVIPDDPALAKTKPVLSRQQKVWAQGKRKQSEWRKACQDRRPLICVAVGLGGCDGPPECDHIWPKSQGGPYVVENGAFLCHEHHRQKTDSELRYRREWLEPDQIAWLASVGWVVWAADGSVSGRGWRHFEPVAR